MADFQFLKNPITQKWVILAPRRARRTNVGKTPETVCPFCIGNEKEEKEVYRFPLSRLHSNSPHASHKEAGSLAAPTLKGEGSIPQQTLDNNWHIRVVTNSFPFAPIHEIIIHSPDHHKNFDELPLSQVELILYTYRERYNANAKNGQVYIFHNRGLAAGESLPHPHTQLVVVPDSVRLEIPSLDKNVIARSESASWRRATKQTPAGKQNTSLKGSKYLFWRGLLSRVGPSFAEASRSFVAREDKKALETIETDQFFIFCPQTSEWPDEVWIAPKRHGEVFGAISDHVITDLAFVLSRLTQIFDLRHGSEFPFNFYIYPGKNWYLRLIPRLKIIGGFELGTSIIVNTQDPRETFVFIKDHFWRPDTELIRQEHQADYWKSV